MCVWVLGGNFRSFFRNCLWLDFFDVFERLMDIMEFRLLFMLRNRGLERGVISL